jgi:chemotaxis protein CheX
MDWNGDVQRITSESWSSLLGFELAPAATDERGHGVCAIVHLTGTFEGTVTLETSAVLARKAASAMFAMEASEVTDAEVHDALGELANVISGQLKPLVDPSCSLSMPTVIAGEKLRIDTPGTHLVCRAAFDCEGEHFQIEIHDRSESRAPASRRLTRKEMES